LLCKCKALSSNPSPPKKTNQPKKRHNITREVADWTAFCLWLWNRQCSGGSREELRESNCGRSLNRSHEPKDLRLELWAHPSVERVKRQVLSSKLELSSFCLKPDLGSRD
jgi:hypothetical protein